MTKKDYLIIGNVLKKLYAGDRDVYLHDISGALVEAFKEDNARFNEQQWHDFLNDES